MESLLTHLLKRGISGTDSVAQTRVLEYLADPLVNRRILGQPLAETQGYYLEEFLCTVSASERFARQRNHGP